MRGFRAILMVGAVETAPHRLELASGIWFEISEDDARVLRATPLRVTEPAPPPATAPATRPGPNR